MEKIKVITKSQEEYLDDLAKAAEQGAMKAIAKLNLGDKYLSKIEAMERLGVSEKVFDRDNAPYLSLYPAGGRYDKYLLSEVMALPKLKKEGRAKKVKIKFA